MPKPNGGREPVVFFHPDLGIGGAERLIVDAAVGLQNLGHRVVIFTSHRDKGHCFDEARDGTLDVRVRGNTLPATVLGRFKILLTILRHYHLLLTICLNGELASIAPGTFFVDQLSAGIPLIRHLFPATHILFYCHFPDLLLVQQRQNLLKRVWRLPFDAIEGWSMRGADRIVVNSQFTKSIVGGVWKGLGGERGPGVIYPAVDTREKKDEGKRLWEDKKVVLSINRFERKKDVGLAVRAFAGLRDDVRMGSKLVIAGGYDPREGENVSYHEELVKLAESLGLKSATAKNIVTALDAPLDTEVLFLLSVPAQLKEMLLQTARLLVYTPTNEHFGIVPLEAMLAEVPVLATNTGGPRETVVDGQTGWLRDPVKVDEWTEIMEKVLREMTDAEVVRMGVKGKKRVQAEFSLEQLAKRLDAEIDDMVRKPRVRTWELQDVLLSLGIAGAVVVAILSLAYSRYISMR